MNESIGIDADEIARERVPTSPQWVLIMADKIEHTAPDVVRAEGEAVPDVLAKVDAAVRAWREGDAQPVSAEIVMALDELSEAWPR